MPSVSHTCLQGAFRDRRQDHLPDCAAVAELGDKVVQARRRRFRCSSIPSPRAAGTVPTTEPSLGTVSLPREMKEQPPSRTRSRRGAPRDPLLMRPVPSVRSGIQTHPEQSRIPRMGRGRFWVRAEPIHIRRFRRHICRSQPIFCRCRPMLVDFSPKSVEIVLRPGQAWPTKADVPPHLVRFCPTWTPTTTRMARRPWRR